MRHTDSVAAVVVVVVVVVVVPVIPLFKQIIRSNTGMTLAVVW